MQALRQLSASMMNYQPLAVDQNPIVLAKPTRRISIPLQHLALWNVVLDIHILLKDF